MVGGCPGCSPGHPRCHPQLAEGVVRGHRQGAVAPGQVWLVGLSTWGRRGFQHCSVSIALVASSE